MKKYNVFPVEKEFSWGTMNVIVLGEHGRGRRQVYVPFHASPDEECLDVGETKTGKPKVIKGACDDGRWLAVVSGSGTYTRGTYGTVYVAPSQKENVKVVAYGYGAYGMAGRIGSWNEFLVIVEDGTFLKVRPAGGSHKRERFWLYFDKDKVHRIEKSEMDLFCEQKDLERPPEKFDELVDLSNLPSLM